MSLSRISNRIVPSITTRVSTRCIASSSRRTQDDLLDILKPASQPQSSTPPSQNGFTRLPSASRFARQNIASRTNVGQEMERSARIESYSKQMFRRWKAGDVYAPHDLSGVEQKKWKTGKKTPQSDAFDTLGINPINEYKNSTILSEYMTETGRIKHSKLTGLRPVNQRKIAKAIRRAVGLGLMPSVHRHPLVVKKSSPMRFI